MQPYSVRSIQWIARFSPPLRLGAQSGSGVRLTPDVAQQRRGQRDEPDGLVPVVQRAGREARQGVFRRRVEHRGGDDELVENEQKERSSAGPL